MASAPTPTRDELAEMAQVLAAEPGMMRLIRLLKAPKAGRSVVDILVDYLRGRDSEDISIGILTNSEKAWKIVGFRRNHPYLNEIMQDPGEAERTWERELLRLPGVHRRPSIIAVPAGYLWAAIERYRQS